MTIATWKYCSIVISRTRKGAKLGSMGSTCDRLEWILKEILIELVIVMKSCTAVQDAGPLRHVVLLSLEPFLETVADCPKNQYGPVACRKHKESVIISRYRDVLRV